MSYRDRQGGMRQTPKVAAALKSGEATLLWAHAAINGKTIAELPTNKRIQLTAALWHLAHEHAMSILLLVQQTMFGSALALLRPAAESYGRGLWILRVATDAQLDAAGRDQFPPMTDMVKALADPTVLGPDSVVGILRGRTWGRLCSYTHSGYMQIGARLGETGLADHYSEDELLMAVGIADVTMHACVIEIATLADDQDLRQEAYERLTSRSGL